MKKTLSILIFALTSFTAIPGLTQAVYTNTDETIYKLTGKAGTSERTEIHNECGVDHLLSIAVFQDTIYYTTWTGELKRFRIGVPGSGETLLTNAGFFNALTVDKNGILYMAAELLVRYDPHSRQLTNLGLMPFTSGGDMIFYRDKLLMAGFNPYTLSTGIYEIDITDVTRSTLYMDAPDFIGLMAYPASCGHNRYFGLSAESDGTRLTEIDLQNKQIINSNFRFADALLDAASTAELGLEDGIEVISVKRTMSDNCINGNGSISLQASTLNGPVSFTLVNSNQTQASGAFFNLRGGLYQFRLTNAKGCTLDTTIALAENVPAGCDQVHIPNAFTPNFDGKNDRFTIALPAFVTDASLHVYNRWGTEVYAGRGNSISWDGSFRGVDQPMGVYVYTMTYTDLNGKRSVKGTLTLIR